MQIGFDFGDEFEPLFTVFAEWLIAVAERNEEAVELVSGVTDDCERIIGIRSDVELALRNESNHLTIKGVGLFVLEWRNDFAHFEMAWLVLFGPDDWHVLFESEASATFKLLELLLHSIILS